MIDYDEIARHDALEQQKLRMALVAKRERLVAAAAPEREIQLVDHQIAANIGLEHWYLTEGAAFMRAASERRMKA